jgi:hypothetical protein
MRPSAERAPRHHATSRRGAIAAAACVCAALVSAGCERARAPALVGQRVSAPAPEDRGELCLDLSAIRACWGGPCGEQGCVVPRPLPSGLTPASGYRCAGRAEARSCRARADDAGEFRCNAQGCVQQHPRAPDSGEWECVDSRGAVHCRKVSDAAGVVPGALEPAFVCGPRRGSEEERVCVDFAPDLPRQGESHSCFSSYRGGARAWHCKPADTPRLGQACTTHAECPPAASCVSGFCLPPYPRPACWFDTDCGDARRCRFGSCTEAGG